MAANLSMNQALVEKLREIVESNLGNEQFGVEDLAREAGMSRSQLHRKLQEITNQSTSRFIREIRLEHAMEMLRNRVATISEIAYRVGFASPTYFSKCFHERYGFPPGEVIRRRVQESAESGAGGGFQDNTFNRISASVSVLYPAVVLFLLLFLGGGYYFFQQYRETDNRIHSIAILPLANLTGDPGKAFFVDGLHDALIGELGQLSKLRVISRTSTLPFRNADVNIQEIADRLGVNHILEGSVYQAEDSLLIQVQLIQVNPEEHHIWARDYHRDTRNILSMLSEVTREIAGNVQVSLTPQEDSLLVNRPQVNPEAYKAYLRGKYHLENYTPEGYKKGIAFLLEAVRIDPADPLPWARLALGYNTAGHGITPPPDAFNKARAAAEQALALDETLGEVHLALALVDLYQEWDWVATEQGFKQALKYDPNIAEAHAHNSWFAMLKGGSADEVIAEQKLAMQLDPFMPLYPTYLGFIYWWAGTNDKAIEAANEALTLNSDFAYAYYIQGLAYGGKGLFEEAVQAHKKASEINSDWRYALALSYALAGNREKALNIAEKLAANPKPVETWGLAEVYTALGETDEAFRWLDACYQMRFSWYPWIYWNPLFDPLKSDPRFNDHLDRLDLPNRTSLASGFQ